MGVLVIGRQHCEGCIEHADLWRKQVRFGVILALRLRLPRGVFPHRGRLADGHTTTEAERVRGRRRRRRGFGRLRTLWKPVRDNLLAQTLCLCRRSKEVLYMSAAVDRSSYPQIAPQPWRCVVGLEEWHHLLAHCLFI